jgi:hypothetical protein
MMAVAVDALVERATDALNAEIDRRVATLMQEAHTILAMVAARHPRGIVFTYDEWRAARTAVLAREDSADYQRVTFRVVKPRRTKGGRR